MSDHPPEGFAPPAPVPTGPAPRLAAAVPPRIEPGQPPVPQSPYPESAAPHQVNRMARAAFTITIVNVAVFLLYRLLYIADIAVNTDAYDVFYCVIGCIAIVPFVLCVIFGHLGMAAAKRSGGTGRGPSGVALGVGYLSIMLWLTAIASAVSAMYLNGPNQPFYLNFFI